MNSIYLAIIGLGIFYLGYKFYSSFIAKHIYGLDEDIKTPAHEFQDDVDYVPTKKHIIFGHHYTSIAGAAPIIGPCIAAYWGWLPALAWVIIGTVFMGAVHDFGALVMSLKEKGRSVADITGNGNNGTVYGPVLSGDAAPVHRMRHHRRCKILRRERPRQYKY